MNGDILQQWTAAQKAAGQSSETIRTRLSYLRRHTRDVDPLSASTGDLAAWIAGHDWSAETRKSARGALVSFYRWAHISGLIETDPAAMLPGVRVPRGLPRPVDEERWRDAADGLGGIVRLAVLLAGHCGLRRGEIARIHTRDLSGRWLTVHGKGGQQRQVPVPSEVASMIAWSTPGWVFPGRFAGHVHPQTITKMVKRATGETPHPYRHRFATSAYAGTRDLFAVQRMLGHRSPETTMRYVRVDEQAMVDAMEAAA